MDALFLGGFHGTPFLVESGRMSGTHPDSWIWQESTCWGMTLWPFLLWRICPGSSSHPSSWRCFMGDTLRPWAYGASLSLCLPLGSLISLPHVGPLQAVLEALDVLLAQKVHSRWVWSRHPDKILGVPGETTGLRASGWKGFWRWQWRSLRLLREIASGSIWVPLVNGSLKEHSELPHLHPQVVGAE